MYGCASRTNLGPLATLFEASWTPSFRSGLRHAAAPSARRRRAVRAAGRCHLGRRAVLALVRRLCRRVLPAGRHARGAGRW